jgi:hypothetical protein
VFNVENLAINGGNIPANGTVVEFNLQIAGRWCKIAYVKIVQLTAGLMEIDFDIVEDEETFDPGNRATFYLRKYRRTISQTIPQGGEYGEALSPMIPYKDREDPGEENRHDLHCRLTNKPGGTASDFAVVIGLADISEAG